VDTRILAIAVTAAAALFLAVLEISRYFRKRSRGPKEEPEPQSLSDGYSGYPEKEKTPARPEEIHGSERTMLLTYTTLILKDVRRPSKNYKADLFRPVLIGRSSDNDIVLEDSSVSRRHLRVFRMGALVYAENLSMINGTLLNGRQLTEPREIMTGSRLQLGNQILTVEID